MREIKFRAWNKNMKKMFKIGQITLEKGIWNYEPENREYIGMSIPYQPSFILMQYTGLHDKNGKEIYEGDIVKIDVDKAIVEYSDDYSGFILKPIGEYYFDSPMLAHNMDIDLEVIGNVYETSWLVKE